MLSQVVHRISTELKKGIFEVSNADVGVRRGVCSYLLFHLKHISVKTCKYTPYIFYICGSVHRNSRLKKSNKMQLYADIYLLLITLHVSGIHRAHHHEYIKL